MKLSLGLARVLVRDKALGEKECDFGLLLSFFIIITGLYTFFRGVTLRTEIGNLAIGMLGCFWTTSSFDRPHGRQEEACVAMARFDFAGS